MPNLASNVPGRVKTETEALVMSEFRTWIFVYEMSIDGLSCLLSGEQKDQLCYKMMDFC